MVIMMQQLTNCCLGLKIEKVSARKKNAEQLRSLLVDKSVIKALDKNTDARATSEREAKENIGWNEIFKFVNIYVELETQVLQKAKATQSSTAIKNRETKKQDVISLLQSVIEIANKRGPRLSSSLVIKQVIKTMKDDFMMDTYGLYYSEVLLKNIFSVRKYLTEIPGNCWQVFLKIYSEILLAPSDGGYRVVVAMLICTIVRGMASQTDMKPGMLISFFGRFFENSSLRQEMEVVTQQVALALNVSMQVIAADSRGQVCQLGERIFPSLLVLWKNRPKDELKRELVTFLSTQMKTHHPGGAKSEASGAFAVDWHQWKVHLKNLYQLIFKDLQEMRERRVFSTGVRNNFLGEEYVDLAADLCHQLYTDESSVVEITQLSADALYPGGHSKKRRLESGWSVLMENVTHHGSTVKVIPWLQLIGVIIGKYPGDVPSEESGSFLNVFLQLVTDSKRPDISSYLLNCIGKFTSLPHAMSSEIWHKLWGCCLRIVSLHHCESEGFQLLSSIIWNKLVIPEKDIWNLFLPFSTMPTEGSVKFLATYLSCCDLPEKHHPDILRTFKSNYGSLYPLREQLMDWLLPVLEDEMENDAGRKRSVNGTVDANLVASVLTSLIMRCPRLPILVLEENSKKGLLSNIEELYLQTTFDIIQIDSSISNDMGFDTSQNCHIPTLLKHMESRLSQFVSQLEVQEPSVLSLQKLAYHCCLFSKVLEQLLYRGVATLSTVSQFDVLSLLEQLLKKLSTQMAKVMLRDGPMSVSPILPYMTQLFSWNCLRNETRFAVAELLRSLTPAQILDNLFRIATEQSCKSRRSNVDSDEDSDGDMDVDDMFDTCESDTTEQHVFGYESLLRQTLSDHQQASLDSVRVLCSWCSYEKAAAPGDVVIESELGTDVIKQKLMSLLDVKTFDEYSPFHLQMMRLIISSLSAPDHYQADVDLKNMILVLKQVVNSHRRDQDICRVSLELMQNLIPYFLGNCSDVRKECRDIILHLLNAFWQLQKNGQYNASVRLAVAKCMEAFIKCDPRGDWAFLQQKDSQSDEDKDEASCCKEFLFCLTDSSLEVRLFCANALSILYTASKEDPLRSTTVPRSQQEHCFEETQRMLNKALQICVSTESLLTGVKQDRLTPEEQKDEKVNRVTSLLVALSTITKASPVCEKRAIFALCVLIGDQGVPVDLVCKVLRQVSDTLGYTSLQQFMASHLPFMIEQWLKLGSKLGDFPLRLLECEDETSFYKNHYKVIVPFLVVHKQMNSVQQLSEKVGVDWLELLRQCLPKILVLILPLFAASKHGMANEQEMKKRVSQASSCYELLAVHLTKEVIERSIPFKLDEIVVETLMCLHSYHVDSELVQSASAISPEPNPPFYDEKVIVATLDYLTQSFSGNARSLVIILSRSPEKIQQILLFLVIHLTRSHRVHEQQRIILMYQLFVRMLMKEFRNDLGGSWAFMLREVIHRLLHIVRATVTGMHSGVLSGNNSHQSDIIEKSMNLLQDVCELAIEHCPRAQLLVRSIDRLGLYAKVLAMLERTELNKYLAQIVNFILPYAENYGKLSKQVQNLLQMLIIDHFDKLKEGISLLDPFPGTRNLDIFKRKHAELKYQSKQFTLREETDWFLTSCQVYCTSSDSHIEGLSFLHQLLGRNQANLKELLSDCKENRRESCLCRLVCMLVHLAKSPCRKVALAAANCLGEIGPVDLHTVAMAPRVQNGGLQISLEAYADKSDMQKYCWIFHLLDQYLLDPCIETVKSASEVLHCLLSTRKGAEFCADYKERLADREFLFHYLHPFHSNRGKRKTAPPVSSSQRQAAVIGDEVLWNPVGRDHAAWIKHLTCSLISSGAVTDTVLQLLEPVCRVKTKFCEVILPYLIHNILDKQYRDFKDVMSQQISGFFSCHCSTRGCAAESRSSTPFILADMTRICMVKESVQTMLSVVRYLRKQRRPKESNQPLTVWDDNFWLDLNYLHIAYAAQFCSAHFSTVMFTEIWCYSHTLEMNQSEGLGEGREAVSCSQNTMLETLSTALSGLEELSFQELLLEAYVQIGDPDGVYGCGAGKLASPPSRIKTYEHENRWDKAVVTYDIGMNDLAGQNKLGILKALSKFGVAHTLEMYLKGLDQDQNSHSPEVEEFRYEAAWRSTQWNLEIPSRMDDCQGFHKSVYSSLCFLKDGDVQSASKAEENARLCVVKLLAEQSLESSSCLYSSLSKLACLAQLRDVMNIKDNEEVTSILDKWQFKQKIEYADFEFLEPIHNMHCVLLQLKWQGQDDAVIDGLLNHHRILASAARKAGQYEIAERAIHHLTDLASSSRPCLHAGLEEAMLFWARGEHSTAKHLMKNLIRKIEKMSGGSKEAERLLPLVLNTYGNWLAETRTENPRVIIETYLDQAASLLLSSDPKDSIALDAFLSLARYAHSQYQRIVSDMKSSAFEAKKDLMRTAQADAKKLKPLVNKRENQPAMDSDRRYLKVLEKQSEIDEAEMLSLREDRTKFLLKAVENFINCLKYGDRHDLRVFHLISLWFDNAQLEEVNQLVKNAVGCIKTYKFLPLMYQLAARMGTKQKCSSFQPTLDKIIEQVTTDHPHHSLFIILALANTKKDGEVLQHSGSRRQMTLAGDAENLDTEGVQALSARAMLERLKSSRVGNIVKEMDRLSAAYTQLANLNVEEHKYGTNPIRFLNSLGISSLKNLTSVAVPTADIQVDPSGEYSNIPYVSHFEPFYKLAGGINLPKIINCRGSDGKCYRQLVKGHDDLRQDVVMQQVFRMVNKLLKKNVEARKRCLTVRTYKVIPLSQRSGLLEWCEGTQPLGLYLHGTSTKKGAHGLYRPHDLLVSECRTRMQAVSKDSSVAKKLKVYLEICKHLQPVLRHFFWEKFPDPACWYERRLAYTKSVATNSIVGYILGLGDRHVQNILIDCNSAELVHIDLGVAFEQGRILPTPETVPFRLTRDIVDGMGVSGIEGVFQRCCEKTMEVMHDNQEALLTILQVLLYDPLYIWTLSPLKAYKLQQRQEPDTLDISTAAPSVTDSPDGDASSSERRGGNVNKMAERVLLRLQQKLQGIEDGVPLSVAGQVNHLIQEAQDPRNLSCLYFGWQPYL